MARPREVSDREILDTARRRFITCGTGVPTSAIAKELGISHATIFNRFGSKEQLMIAALGPPRQLPWAEIVAAGPDDRPTQIQLREIAATVSHYFTLVAEGFTLLQAAGIPPERVFDGCDEPPPVQAFKALSGWLRRARTRGLIGKCNIPALTITILGALRNWSFNAQMSNREVSGAAAHSYISKLVDLLWKGIEPEQGR